MSLLILLFCIVILVFLTAYVKISPFLALLMVSVLSGVLLGMPLAKISKAMSDGLGETLGSLTIIIVLGAMLGKLVAASGAADTISEFCRSVFGEKNMVYAMTLTGFIVGIPLYYNVGFILLIPIIFSVSRKYNLPLIYIGLPTLASLSVMHGFMPPHPSPMALVTQFQADVALTFLYGLIVAIPAILIAGPLFATRLKAIPVNPAASYFTVVEHQPGHKFPGIATSLFTCLLPIFIILGGAAILLSPAISASAAEVVRFVSQPNMVMMVTIIVATYTLGIRTGSSVKSIMALYTEGAKEVSVVLLIIGSAGVLKQIFIESRLKDDLSVMLAGCQMPPLLLAWCITAALRLCLGSATIAGITAAGIVFPLTMHAPVSKELLVLAIGAGSLFGSHINDSAFWLYKEYFGLSIKNTLLTWTVMESLVSVIGLGGALLINQFIHPTNN